MLPVENPDSAPPAINITATFVHNEPTSLPIIQEMKLPEAMYDALENNKYPSYEVSFRFDARLSHASLKKILPCRSSPRFLMRSELCV